MLGLQLYRPCHIGDLDGLTEKPLDLVLGTHGSAHALQRRIATQRVAARHVKPILSIGQVAQEIWEAAGVVPGRQIGVHHQFTAAVPLIVVQLFVFVVAVAVEGDLGGDEGPEEFEEGRQEDVGRDSVGGLVLTFFVEAGVGAMSRNGFLAKTLSLLRLKLHGGNIPVR